MILGSFLTTPEFYLALHFIGCGIRNNFFVDRPIYWSLVHASGCNSLKRLVSVAMSLVCIAYRYLMSVSCFQSTFREGSVKLHSWKNLFRLSLTCNCGLLALCTYDCSGCMWMERNLFVPILLMPCALARSVERWSYSTLPDSFPKWQGSAWIFKAAEFISRVDRKSSPPRYVLNYSNDRTEDKTIHYGLCIIFPLTFIPGRDSYSEGNKQHVLNSMQLSQWEIHSCLASQEIPSPYCNLNMCYHALRCSALGPVLSELN
jgi:hypothetical protein